MPSKGAAGIPNGVSPTAIRYQGPIALDASADTKVRVLSGSTWSALNEAVFAVGPVAENLRISEITYRGPERPWGQERLAPQHAQRGLPRLGGPMTRM